MRLAVGEGLIGHEAVAEVLRVLADDPPELDRQGGGNRDRAGDFEVVVDGAAGYRGRLDALDHVGGIEPADAVDRGAEFVRLDAQRVFGQTLKVEPDRDRQPAQERQNQGRLDRHVDEQEARQPVEPRCHIATPP